MYAAHAHSFSDAPPAPCCSREEPASSPRLRCLPSPPAAPAGPAPGSALPCSNPGCCLLAGHECPCYDALPLGALAFELRIPPQDLTERGRLQPHRVRAELIDRALEVRLYAASSRLRLVDVGVWSIGAYVHWRRERELDFVVIDAVDACLRAQLPPGGGVPTFERGSALARIAAGHATFSFRP